MLIDIHTHRKEPTSGESSQRLSIYNLKDGERPDERRFASAGIHPWEADEGSEHRLEQLAPILEERQIIAIGEIGMDKRTGRCDIARQAMIFQEQIAYANRLAKPTIIHCVGAWNELLRLKKNMLTPSIVHGFRGKPQLMASLCKVGFYLSFGEKFNENSLRETPLDRLFLETDDSRIDLKELYLKVASVKGIDPHEMECAIERNFRKLFGTERNT